MIKLINIKLSLISKFFLLLIYVILDFIYLYFYFYDNIESYKIEIKHLSIKTKLILLLLLMTSHYVHYLKTKSCHQDTFTHSLYTYAKKKKKRYLGYQETL